MLVSKRPKFSCAFLIQLMDIEVEEAVSMLCRARSSPMRPAGRGLNSYPDTCWTGLRHLALMNIVFVTCADRDRIN